MTLSSLGETGLTSLTVRGLLARRISLLTARALPGAAGELILVDNLRWW